jgi:soluble lytic murein transglycosylase-like protein
MTVLALCLAVSFSALPGANAYLDGAEAARQGRHTEAIAAFLNAGEVDPTLRPYAEIRVGDALAAQQDQPGATSAYRRVLDAFPEGPWTRMAHARLAEQLFRLTRFRESAPHFHKVFNLPVAPWNLQTLRDQSAEAMLHDPETMATGFGLFRITIEDSIIAKDRLLAAIQLIRSPKDEDRRVAVSGMLRSNGVDEAGRALLLHATPLKAADGTPLLWQDMPQSLAATADPATMQALARANQDNPWLRYWLSFIARSRALKQSNAAAIPISRVLAGAAPDTLETGDVLWWLADRLSKDDTTAAEALFRLLIETCPSHFRADDAWVRIAELRIAAKDRDAAIEAYVALATQYPESRFRAEGEYRAAEMALAAGKTEQGNALLQSAARSTVGSFYAHRALAQLPDAPGESVRNLKIDGGKTTLEAFPGLSAPVLPLPEFVQQDPRVQRMRFFGEHGLDEGEWEAMDLCAGLAKHANPAPYYRAAAESGFGHTAERFADKHGWGLRDGAPTLARRRLSYPLAFWPQFKSVAKEAGVDPFLMMAMARQESTFRASIKSHAGATGVMQVMPATAKWMAKVDDNIKPHHVSHLESAVNSIRLGAFYLKRMSASYNGHLVHATAAYNAGPGNLNKWKKQFGAADLDTFIEAIPFSETKDYVKKVLGNYAAYHSLYPAPDTLP